MADNEPVNPLTCDLATIAVVRFKGVREDVQGRIVKPGLAITRAAEGDQLDARPRFNLTHMPTGLGVSMRMCGHHVLIAAELAAASYVDWTVPDKDDVVVAVKATDLLEQLRPISPCSGGYCTGDGPEPPSYGVRCTTCDFDWFDEDDEGPLSLKDAQQIADDHRCEPELQIKSPVTGQWHATWAVAKAEESVNADGGPS